MLQATTIYEPIHERLATVEKRLNELARNRFPFLSQMLGHVYEPAGKRFRPALTLLASNFHPHDGDSAERVEIMATAVELLHIASLIHDDTVDASEIRRGKPTISSLWGRNAAVLVGDYIFASSATFVCDTGHVGVIRRFSETIMELSSGELQELVGAFNYNQTLDGYYERIYDKTASLFSTAGESGAILSGAPDHFVRALKEYSCQLGMAFQIVDDILDFEGTVAEVGKPVGRDLAHGILTLPALIAVERSGSDNPVREFFQRPQDEGLLAAALDLVQRPSNIEAAYAVARKRCQVARDNLMMLPRNPSRDALEELLDYVVARRS